MAQQMSVAAHRRLTREHPNLGAFIEWHGPGWQQVLDMLVPQWNSPGQPDLERVLVDALVAYVTGQRAASSTEETTEAEET